MHAMFIADGPFATLLKEQKARRASDTPFGLSPSLLRRLPNPIKSYLRSLSADSSSLDRRKAPQIIDGFKNVEVYNLIIKLLHLEEFAAPTNGTTGFWDNYLDDDY